MSLIESAIAANRKNAGRHDPSLANKPAPKVAILTCMDPRLNDLLQWLDIKPADADVIARQERRTSDSTLWLIPVCRVLFPGLVKPISTAWVEWPYVRSPAPLTTQLKDRARPRFLASRSRSRHCHPPARRAALAHR
jgi:hypothetical protein